MFHSFKIYKKDEHGEHVWWTDMNFPCGTKPQEVRDKLMLDYPDDSFIVVKRSWIMGV